MALETVATLSLMCDPRDLGQTIGDQSEGDGPATGGHVPDEGFDPTVFLFDNVPGGVGLAERIHEQAAELVSSARLLVMGCPCSDGCPMCVGATEMGGIRKRATLTLLKKILHAA